MNILGGISSAAGAKSNPNEPKTDKLLLNVFNYLKLFCKKDTSVNWNIALTLNSVLLYSLLLPWRRSTAPLEATNERCSVPTFVFSSSLSEVTPNEDAKNEGESFHFLAISETEATNERSLTIRESIPLLAALLLLNVNKQPQMNRRS